MSSLGAGVDTMLASGRPCRTSYSLMLCSVSCAAISLARLPEPASIEKWTWMDELKSRRAGRARVMSLIVTLSGVVAAASATQRHAVRCNVPPAGAPAARFCARWYVWRSEPVGSTNLAGI